MITNMQRCLIGDIGLLTKEHFLQYKRILEIGDVLSEYSRMLDSNCGAMTFAYLSFVGDSKKNDLINESFKHFLDQNQKLLNEMNEKIRKIQTGEAENVSAKR